MFTVCIWFMLLGCMYYDLRSWKVERFVCLELMLTCAMVVKSELQKLHTILLSWYQLLFMIYHYWISYKSIQAHVHMHIHAHAQTHTAFHRCSAWTCNFTVLILNFRLGQLSFEVLCHVSSCRVSYVMYHVFYLEPNTSLIQVFLSVASVQVSCCQPCNLSLHPIFSWCTILASVFVMVLLIRYFCLNMFVSSYYVSDMMISSDSQLFEESHRWFQPHSNTHCK